MPTKKDTDADRQGLVDDLAASHDEVEKARQQGIYERFPWEDPKAKYADDDNSPDARAWRVLRDHREMGSRE